MTLSSSIFNQAYERFQAIHVRESGRRLVSFRDGHSLAWELESYEDAVYSAARNYLDPEAWTEEMVGRGAILGRVQKAVVFPDSRLLEWTGERGPLGSACKKLLEARGDPAGQRRLERLFYELYGLGRAEGGVFEAIVAQCGRAYELLAYLFFIADCTRFLPFRARALAAAFRELGVPQAARGRCSWESYQAYLGALREVQWRLVSKMGSHVTLLNAHSFCWVLARYAGGAATPAVPEIPEARLFPGALLAAGRPKAYLPKDEAIPCDMQKESEFRRASGELAEKKAMEAERARLLAEGCSAKYVDDQVKWVGDCPELGYDIASVDRDGAKRHIEVKNISHCNRFFLSDNEWRASQALPNYWFYLVDVTDQGRSVVEMLRASELERGHLCPCQYRVKFARKARR